MNYRLATINDIDHLVRLRKQQLIDEGIEPNQDIDSELVQFFKVKLADESLVQWLVEDGDEIVACGAVIIYDFPPSYTNKSGKKAYITNMYTHDHYRGRGIATSLLTKLVEGTKRRGITIMWLGASELGKPVYKKFGFKETDEWMELDV